MVEQSSINVDCRYFAINKEHSYVQYEARLTQEQYAQLTLKDSGVKSNKGKVLIQCLDRSGSMSGRPIEAVKMGAIKIGEAVLESEQSPFEEFITLTYDNKIETNRQADGYFDKVLYEHFIRRTTGRGSTDFKIVFEWIQEYLSQRKNGLTEVVIIFFTDG